MLHLVDRDVSMLEGGGHVDIEGSLPIATETATQRSLRQSK